MALHIPASPRLHIALAAALVALAIAAFAALAGAPAAHAATCPQVDLPGNGYITSLTVRRVSCKTGKSVAVSYAKCRLKHGRRGRCTARTVRGYRCKESHRTTIPTEINAKVTCTRGSRRIVHTYQQTT